MPDRGGQGGYIANFSRATSSAAAPRIWRRTADPSRLTSVPFVQGAFVFITFSTAIYGSDRCCRAWDCKRGARIKYLNASWKRLREQRRAREAALSQCRSAAPISGVLSLPLPTHSDGQVTKVCAERERERERRACGDLVRHGRLYSASDAIFKPFSKCALQEY